MQSIFYFLDYSESIFQNQYLIEKKGNILMFHSSSSMIKSGGKHLPKTTKNLFGINSLEALSWET